MLPFPSALFDTGLLDLLLPHFLLVALSLVLLLVFVVWDAFAVALVDAAPGRRLEPLPALLALERLSPGVGHSLVLNQLVPAKKTQKNELKSITIKGTILT